MYAVNLANVCYVIIYFFKKKKKRLIELQENGLFNYWDLWFRTMPRTCIENIQSGVGGLSKKTKDKHQPLSLKNLTGAFVVLTAGLSLSFLTFIHEQIIASLVRRR